jgi:hypothetical protein
MQLLRTAGYAPQYVASTDIEQVDAEIKVVGDIVVQIDSRSGDAVAVNKHYGKGKNFRSVSWDVGNDGEILKWIIAAIKHKL